MVRFTLTLSLVLLLASDPVRAEPVLGAEFRLQQEAFLTRDGDRLERAIGNDAAVTTSSLRLKAQGNSGSWSYDFHYLLEGFYSSDFSGLEMSTPSNSNANLLDLQSAISHDGDGSLDHRLDRASVAYSTPHTVVSIGRQALTWGRGQVFQPMDLFNPFPPNASDKSYKPGTDMVYAQYLYDNGADLQGIIVPRRDADGPTSSDDSSAAIKGLWPVDDLELEIVLASDYSEPVLGLGSAGPLGDALWKFDIVATNSSDRDGVVSAVANLNHSWDWGEKPVSAFIEYYRNGFGVTDQRSVDELPDDLIERIARGQIFGTGRDYFDVGGTVHWTPLLQITPAAIVNLNDQSVLLLTTAQYSISNQSNLVFSAQLPLAPRGTEYGGRQTTDGSGEYGRAPYSFLIRFERFY